MPLLFQDNFLPMYSTVALARVGWFWLYVGTDAIAHQGKVFRTYGPPTIAKIWLYRA